MQWFYSIQSDLIYTNYAIRFYEHLNRIIIIIIIMIIIIIILIIIIISFTRPS